MSLSSLKSKLVQLVYDSVSIVSSAVIIIMLVFTFFFRIAGVVGPSMMNTLYDGDKLVVSAFVKKPQAGDVIIITQPNAFHEPIVKRIVALGGQEVAIDFSTGRVYVDGELKIEPYVKGITNERQNFDSPQIVPQGKVFVMGDNRNNSTDSRSSLIGFVDENYILGKVLGRIYPKGSWGIQ